VADSIFSACIRPIKAGRASSGAFVKVLNNGAKHRRIEFGEIRLPLYRTDASQERLEIGLRNRRQPRRDTDELLKLPLAAYTIIDPCFDEDLAEKYRADRRVTVLRMNSLDALTPPELLRPAAPFDCLLIDGDHNWYTVFNELRLIHEHGLLRPAASSSCTMSVGPTDAATCTTSPTPSPRSFVTPCAPAIVEGQSQLGEANGNNSHLANAVEEGGPRNGVLTAVEDFLALHAKDYRFFPVKMEFGLGVLQLRAPRRARALAFPLAPHRGPDAEWVRKLAAWSSRA